MKLFQELSFLNLLIYFQRIIEFFFKVKKLIKKIYYKIIFLFVLKKKRDNFFSFKI